MASRWEFKNSEIKLAALAVAGVLAFFQVSVSRAQSQEGETSSVIHGATNNPGEASGTTNIDHSGLGQTINRPEDNAPKSPDDVIPDNPDLQPTSTSATSNQSTVGRQRPETVDHLDQYREDLADRNAFTEKADDRLAHINGQLMNLQDKSAVLEKQDQAKMKSELEALIGQRDKLESMISSVQKGARADFLKNKKQIEATMDDLDQKIASAQKRYSGTP